VLCSGNIQAHSRVFATKENRTLNLAHCNNPASWELIGQATV
jgi:hypothetical protein